MPVRKNRLINVQALKHAPFYSLKTRTGVITAIAAATASAGHLIAVRNTGSAEFNVTRMRLAWLSSVDPSVEQLIGFIVNKLTAYSVAHSGGTGASTGNPVSRAEATGTPYAAITAIAHRTAGTDELTAGTQTIGESLGRMDDFALADAATVKHTKFEQVWQSPDKHPLFCIGASEGILVRNAVLMANSLAGNLDLELDGWIR
jgi:hypothetical protein